MSKPEQLYDVFIFERASRNIESVAGQNMRKSVREGSYSQSAEKRMNTVSPLLNDDYDVEMVTAGKYKVGDTLP